VERRDWRVGDLRRHDQRPDPAFPPDPLDAAAAAALQGGQAMSEDIVAMARAAYRDERLADGPLYGKLADEIERLRARVEELEKVRAAAQALIDEDAGDDPAEDGWWEWEKNCEALSVALKEVSRLQTQVRELKKGAIAADPFAAPDWVGP